MGRFKLIDSGRSLGLSKRAGNRIYLTDYDYIFISDIDPDTWEDYREKDIFLIFSTGPVRAKNVVTGEMIRNADKKLIEDVIGELHNKVQLMLSEN